MKKLVLSALLAALLPSLTAHARFVFTLQQAGANVVVSGSGTLNTTALTQLNGSSARYDVNGLLYPQGGDLIGGSGDSTLANVYSGLTGPTTFGSDYGADADSGSGAAVGIYTFASPTALIAPLNYVSGTALTTSSTYNNATFATLGFTPGTYTYTWGTGDTADSLVITSDVPEPSTWAAVALGAAGLGVVTLRRRRASVA